MSFAVLHVEEGSSKDLADFEHQEMWVDGVQTWGEGCLNVEVEGLKKRKKFLDEQTEKSLQSVSTEDDGCFWHQPYDLVKG